MRDPGFQTQDTLEPARTPRRQASVATHEAVDRRNDGLAGRARRYSAIVMPAGIVGGITYGLPAAVSVLCVAVAENMSCSRSRPADIPLTYR